jgi:predicted CxxxxCH...CXXCH cytochrome family protein
MAKVIKRKLNGMSWWMKTSIVLLLTMATTVFMYQGWYQPVPAQAAITEQAAWTVVSTAGAPAAANVTIAAGTNRMLVVGVSVTTSAAVTQTCSVSYGGTALTEVPGTATGGTSALQHTYLFYMPENATLMDNTARSLAVTVTGGTIRYSSVYKAVFAGTDPTSPIASSTGRAVTTTGTPSFATGLVINSGDQAVEIINATRSASTTYRTITTWKTGWSAASSLAVQQGGATNGTSNYIGTSTTASASDTSAHTWSGTSLYSISGMVIHAYTAPADSSAPVAGTVTISPDISSTYTSKTPTITTTFTDLESAVTTCEYTTDGTTWVAGGVSGAASSYTCTATPTGLAGFLNINMRATSTGGTTTATQIQRTVDTTVPADGVLTVTKGNAQNRISWTAATDSGGGSISSYILRFATGATAPADCASGTAVTGSPFSSATLSTVHTPLVNGTQYSYRLCATDNLGNTSGGVTGTGTPTATLPAVITTCNGCHGYTNAFVDAASRNASGSGTFQGSHNKHVVGQIIACSTCHLTPATTTSADFAHSNDQIEMAASINGGIYSQGSSIAATNTFNPGTCSGTTCHANVYSTGSGTTLNWGTAGGGCGSCHFNSPTVGAFQANGAPSTGGHNMHMNVNGTVCGDCHAGTVKNVSGGDSHGNGVINVSTGYNGGTPPAKRVAGGTYYTCSAAACHGNPYAAGAATTGVWGTGIGGCVACHNDSGVITATGPATGSHAAHGSVAVCTDCHNTGTTATASPATGHGNDNIDVNNGYPATVAKHVIGSYTGTCTTASCHSDGTSVATGTAKLAETPVWGTASGCNVCHGSGGSTGAPSYENLKHNAGTGAGTGWTTPTNVAAADSVYAVFNTTTQTYLYATQFGYLTTDVPDTATVKGIAVVIHGNAASATAAQRQVRVALTQNGAAVVGTPKTAIELNQTTDTEVVVGGVTDLWGTTWTPAQIRATTFGVAISDNDTTAGAINIDQIKVVVFTDASPKMNSHASHSSKTCDVCHSNVTNVGGTAIANATLHNNGTYNLQVITGQTFTYVYSALGGSCSSVSCHGTAQWGAASLDCVGCHSSPITRTKGRPGTTLAAVSTEFGLAWGHKKTGRGGVTKADCVVCHLEGSYATQAQSAFHGDGNIDLRDPDGAGETPINKVSAATPFVFQRFSTSYAATSRTATGATTDAIDNVVTIKFCMACHDNNGATNPTARSNNGGTGTAAMPFGGIALGTTYTTLNGATAAGTQGLVDVKTQFLSTNSSRHPVGAANSRAYPFSTRLAPPYNNIGTTRDANTAASNTASPRVKANSVVIYCNDCHTLVTSMTTRTITAHGSTGTLRGTVWVASPSLCTQCHAPAAGAAQTTSNGYFTSSQHGAGSALTTGSGNISTGTLTCHNCHFSAIAAPARPIRAADIHGFNGLLATGGAWTAGGGSGMRPIAFMRNVGRWPVASASPRPYVSTLAGPGQSATPAAGSASCAGGNTSGCANNHGAYSPGGSY